MSGDGRETPNKLGWAAAMWQTPTTVDAQGRGYTYPGGDHDRPFLALTGQAQRWATPTSRDRKDGADPSSAVPTNALLGRQAPRIMTDGADSSPSRRTLRRLLQALSTLASLSN